MKRWIPLLVTMIAVAALALAFSGEPDTAPSIDNGASDGLKVAARYLAGRGRDVSALEEADPGAGTPGVVALALPTVRPWAPEEATALAMWVRRGGRLVLLASRGGPPPGELEQALSLESSHATGAGTGTWPEWQARAASRRTLTGRAGTVVAEAGPWRVDCPPDATVTYRDGEDRPRVCEARLGRGRITLVNDVSAITNGHLPLADNLAFIEELFPTDAPVRFAEHHHRAGTVDGAEHAGRLDALVAQVALVYLLVAWQRARPLGPARPGLTDREPGLVAELRTLGKLHAAGGHGPDAAERMLAMARARFAGDERLAGLPQSVVTTAQAVAVGKRLAEMERRSG